MCSLIKVVVTKTSPPLSRPNHDGGRRRVRDTGLFLGIAHFPDAETQRKNKDGVTITWRGETEGERDGGNEWCIITHY